jgi:hypothetical protein
MFCIVFILYQILLNADIGYETAVGVSYLAYCPSIIGVIAPIVGVVLGIISLVRKEPRKVFAIIGIMLGILGGLGMCLVIFIITFMSRT